MGNDGMDANVTKGRKIDPSTVSQIVGNRSHAMDIFCVTKGSEQDRAADILRGIVLEDGEQLGSQKLVFLCCMDSD